MMVAVQGTNSFSDYGVFLRAMSVALSNMKPEDKYFYIYTIGPTNINSFVLEFCNLSERGMKSRGKKIKQYRVSPQWVDENLKDFDYFAFLSQPKQAMSALAQKAEYIGVETGTFQY